MEDAAGEAAGDAEGEEDVKSKRGEPQCTSAVAAAGRVENKHPVVCLVPEMGSVQMTGKCRIGLGSGWCIGGGAQYKLRR